MLLVVDQAIRAPASRAQDALLDPDFYDHLGESSPIEAVEILADQRNGDQAVQRVRLRFTGNVNSTVRRFVDPTKLTWVQETVTDLNRLRSQIRTIPDRYARLLSFDGWYELREVDQSQTTQHLECELQVNVPGVGRLAERGIARGLREHLANQASVIERMAG